MMEPIVRLMVACEDARPRKGVRNKFDIFGVITTVGAKRQAFPVRLSFAVYLVLTDGHGRGRGRIAVVKDETDELVYDGESFACDFGADPTALFAATIRIPFCLIPEAGHYTVQFMYNDVVLKEYFIHVRETQ